MKYPSDSEIDAAKRSAAAKGTTAELLTFEDLDVAVIVHAMTPREWANYVDAQQRDTSDAREAAYADHVVWPSATEADAVATRIPAFVALVVAELHLLAGRIPADPETCILDRDTPAAKLARAGLTPEKRDALLMQYNRPRQLTLARFPTLDMSVAGRGFALVVKVPSKPVYRARLEVYNKAKSEGSGTWDCAAQAGVDFIVWTSEGDDPAPIFQAWPGVVAGDLISLFQVVGGATSKAERRRL
jgi:hypothetical protein